MSNVTRVDESDPRVRVLSEFSGSSDSPLPGLDLLQILAHDVQHAPALLRMLEVVNDGGALPRRMKYLVGLLLADMAGDHYTGARYRKAAVRDGVPAEVIEAALGDYDSDPRLHDRERWALRFAEQMFVDAKKVDDVFYDELRRRFSDPEIMEIGTFAGVNYAMCLLVSTLGIGPDDE